MHRFYAPDITSDTYTLGKDESKHAIRVLHLKAGSAIELVDGKGGLYQAKITAADPKRCAVRVMQTQLEYGKYDHYLHIAIAPTKNITRFKWFLEKATEIGIDEVTPLHCSNSERKTIKMDRLNKVIESAMKQSLGAYHPKLNELTKFQTFVQQQWDGQQFIAHCSEEEKPHLKELLTAKESSLILIGPEGDFTQGEVSKARQSGFQSISLGQTRLRTETAGIAACMVVAIVNDT